jgi:hypothetical protein
MAKIKSDHASHRIPRWLLANEQLSNMLLAALEYLSAAKQTAPSLGRTASPSLSISLACCASNCSTREFARRAKDYLFLPPGDRKAASEREEWLTKRMESQGGRLGRSRLNQSRVSPAHS